MTAETVPQNQAAPADVAKTNTADNNLVQMRRLLENERAEKERAIAENRRLEQERERFARGNKNEEEDEESDDNESNDSDYEALEEAKKIRVNELILLQFMENNNEINKEDVIEEYSLKELIN